MSEALRVPFRQVFADLAPRFRWGLFRGVSGGVPIVYIGFAESDSRLIAVRELNASTLQRDAYFGASIITAAQRSVLSLQSFNCRDRHGSCCCQLPLRPCQKRTRSFNLPN